MKQFKNCLLGVISGILLAVTSVNAAENSIESMTVAQQSGILNVKMTFKEPLAELPPGFSVAKPARIAFDFVNTLNGLKKSTQVFNEGDLKSANIVQADGRTRVVLNLNQAMTYESALDGNSLLIKLTPSATTAGTPQVEHFAQARPTQDTNMIRDINFRRGKDGEARINVELSDPNAGIDIHQQGQNLIVDFVKVSAPDVLRKRLDVTDFATPVVSMTTVQQGNNVRMKIGRAHV